MSATLASVAVPPAALAGSPAARIDPLDWTKGALVLFMVAYHSINYSVYNSLAFCFLPFLPPSFVMIAGIVVGSVYATRYNLGSWKPYARLMVRGIKLFLLFALLNVGFCIMLERSLSGGFVEFVSRSGIIFLSGNGRSGIFEVLLPIAYFLLLAPVLLWLRPRAASAIPVCGIALFVLCFVLERQGLSSRNLDLLSAGTLGMALGLIPITATDRFAKRWVGPLLIYFVYRLCKWFLNDIYPVEMFGAAASVLLLYTCALRLNMSSWTGRQIVLLGRYSLLAYLAQIGLLQAIVKLRGGKPEDWSGVIAAGLLTSILLFFVVNQIHFFRRSSRFVDLVYKGVFA